MMDRLLFEVESMLSNDVNDNKAIGEHGAIEILSKSKDKIVILTHCNTGSLATAGYGTALGVIRSLNSTSKLGENANMVLNYNVDELCLLF